MNCSKRRRSGYEYKQKYGRRISQLIQHKSDSLVRRTKRQLRSDVSIFAAVRIGERNEKNDPRLFICFDIATADGPGVRCPPSCLLVGTRSADLYIRHTIPERQTVTRQYHEVIAKDAIAYDPLGIRAVVGTEGGDAPAFDVGNENGHALDGSTTRLELVNSRY
jgi:hypothetical protein